MLKEMEVLGVGGFYPSLEALHRGLRRNKELFNKSVAKGSGLNPQLDLKDSAKSPDLNPDPDLILIYKTDIQKKIWSPLLTIQCSGRK